MDSKPQAADELLQHPDLWSAQKLCDHEPLAHPSGFPALDEHLPGGGWPQAGLGELLLNTLGVGELRLLAPLLAKLSHSQERWVAWVSPPFIPYAPALDALGIDVSKMLLIHPKSHKEALWALEQDSKSGTCSAVLAWLDESQLKLKDTRRLQLAAKQGATFTCLFRPQGAAEQNSMAELRLLIRSDSTANAHELELCIHKRRRGWPIRGLRVSLPEALKPAAITEQLTLWRNMRQKPEQPVTPSPVEGFARPTPVHSGSPMVH